MKATVTTTKGKTFRYVYVGDPNEKIYELQKKNYDLNVLIMKEFKRHNALLEKLFKKLK